MVAETLGGTPYKLTIRGREFTGPVSGEVVVQGLAAVKLESRDGRLVADGPIPDGVPLQVRLRADGHLIVLQSWLTPEDFKFPWLIEIDFPPFRDWCNGNVLAKKLKVAERVYCFTIDGCAAESRRSATETCDPAIAVTIERKRRRHLSSQRCWSLHWPR